MRKNPIVSHIQSFVRRQGRMTAAQAHALQTYQDDYMLDASKSWDLSDIFPGVEKFVLEIGFGNSESLIQQAIDEPDKGFVGIEVHSPGLGHCMQLCHQHDLCNLRVCQADAFLVLQQCIADASLDRIQIYFPDPWPKNRHHKRRLIQSVFVDTLASKCRSGALVHMATDWQPYAEHALSVFAEHSGLENLSLTQDYVAKPSYRPETKFERRGYALGHRSHDLLFKRL